MGSFCHNLQRDYQGSALASSHLTVDSTAVNPQNILSQLKLPDPLEGKNTAQERFLLNGHRFCSRSEAACGILLEKYIPGFTLTKGITYQVPIGISPEGHVRTVDFRFKDTLIEFHPPRIWSRVTRLGDIPTRKTARKLRKLLYSGKLPKKKKKMIREKLRSILKTQYWKRRRKAIDSGGVFQHCKLIVIGNAKELYEQVLLVLAPENAPPLETFLREFSSLQKKCKECPPPHAA